MLKSLELLGFKSFADRTHFDFPAGVTVIVGPNGSGKSNVVDAFRWVLGEQSAKSLRGKKAADVIFGGSSGATGRRQMGAAEVTMVFDNADHRFSIETDEVRITRRVYRGNDERSEGEYLINNQICKLSDIRELLMGTGLGAYSFIEQGRVDYLLQSSPTERRLLFEEAAGISRFLKKKQETQRRLEVCEQNLLRISDKVAERQARLAQVCSQAEKAVKFREFNARLQELKFQAAAMDYTLMAANLKKVTAEIERLQAEQDACQTEIDAATEKLQQYENEANSFEAEIRDINEQVSENRQGIVAAASVVDFQSKRMEELEQSVETERQSISEMRHNMADTSQAHRAVLDELEQARKTHDQLANTLGTIRMAAEEATQICEAARGEKEQCRDQYNALMRTIATMENEISLLIQQEKKTTQQIQQSTARGVSKNEELQKLLGARRELDGRQAELEALKNRCEEDKTAAHDELESCKRLWNEAKANLADLRQRHSEMGGRITTLQGLQERHEGLSPGVCYLLTEAKRQSESPFHDIQGLVADMIQVEIKATSIIEVALGERAQYLVVSPFSPLREALRRNPQGLPGRVGFIWMEDFLTDSQSQNLGKAASNAPQTSTPRTDALQTNALRTDVPRTNVWLTNSLEGLPGVIGRADQFVQCSEAYLPLFRFMLGETWIVENLDVAYRLQEEIWAGKHQLSLAPALNCEGKAAFPQAFAGMMPMPRIHFVTLSGERLDADGTLCIGPQHTSSGLILRPNELRTLAPQLTLLLEEIHRSEEEVQKAEQKRLRQENLVKQFEQESLDADRQLRSHEKEVSTMNERIAQMEKQQAEWAQMRTAYERQLNETQTQRERRELEKNGKDAEATQFKAKLLELETALTQCESEQRKKNDAVTQNEVRLAKSEERLKGLEAQIRQHENVVRERRRSLEERKRQLVKWLAQLADSQRLVLDSEMKLATLYSQKDTVSKGLSELQKKRGALKKGRSEQNSIANRFQKKMQKITTGLNASQVEAGKLEQEQNQILARMADEFQMDADEFLSRIANPTEEERAEHSSVQREIIELRDQIQQLGNINTEALAELDEVEEGYTKISERYDDLCKSRDELVQFIENVDTITRRRFMETYERISDYFYHIFRDLFGGGNAQLVMEEGVDPLESGIEIEVQPPGKDLRSLSLMSGGEKAMTCIALLFALFKNAPSQFCILDEVDAPLDEINIGRLMNILQQFLDQVQFIFISHSKKTMAAANTIYGITMQDSGVSKQVSYRFEEVNDDGKLAELGIHLFPDETNSAAAG